MALDPDVAAILRKYGIESEQPQEPSTWDTITQPLKTLVGFTGGILPQVVLGGTDLYKEAAQKELEALAASKGLGVEDLTPAQRTEALPGLGRVITEADIFENNTPGRIAAAPLRLLGDIVGDPTSYLGGAGALTKLRAARRIGQGAEALDVLKAARLAGEGIDSLDKATRAGQFVQKAGEALREGKRLKAAANLALGTIPQAPFGVLPAVAYAPEAYRGVTGAVGQAKEAFSQGDYGGAAEAAAQGLGTGIVYGLLAKGAYSEAFGKEAGRFSGELARAAELRAQAAAAAATPPVTGADAVAKYMPDMAEAFPNPEPFQPPQPPPAGYPSVADSNLSPYMVGTQYPNPAGDIQVTTPPPPPGPRGYPNPERAPRLPRVRSANQPVAGELATAVANPVMAGEGGQILGTADQKLGDNPQAPAQAAPTMPPPQPTLAPEPPPAAVAPVPQPEAPTTPVAPPVAPGAIEQIAALAAQVDSPEKAWEVINTAKTLGAQEADIVAGFKAAGFTDDDLGSLFAEPVIKAPEPVANVGTSAQVPTVTPKPEKPPAPPNEKKVAAVTTVLNNVFDSNTPAQKVSEDALSKYLGGSAAKKTAKAVNELLDNLTDLQKLPGKKFTRTLKPGVDAEATLAAMKALHPTQVDALDAAYSRIVKPPETVQAPIPTEVKQVPPQIDPEALRASILEGVDPNGDPNAPALVAARKRLGGLSPEEKQALASLSPDKPVDLTKSPSVVAQSLARRLGLTQEKESFRADGTVLRKAQVGAGVEPVAKPPVVPAATPARPVETAPPGATPTTNLSGEAYKSRLNARIEEKQARLASLDPKSPEHAELSAEINANRQFIEQVDLAQKTFPTLPIGEALDKTKELLSQSLEKDTVGRGEPLPEGAKPIETISPKAEENRRVGALHSKAQQLRTDLEVAQTKGEAEKAAQLEKELSTAEGELQSNYPRTKLLDSIDRSNPEQVALAEKIIEVSQGSKFANMARGRGINIGDVSPEAMASFYQNTFRRLSKGNAMERGEDGVLTGMLNATGAQELQKIVRREKLLGEKKEGALQILMDALGLKTIVKTAEDGTGKLRDIGESGTDETSKLMRAEKEQAVSKIEAGGEKAILDEIKLGDPTGEARVLLVQNVADRSGIEPGLVAAMGRLKPQLDQLEKQAFKGGSKEAGLAKVQEYLTEAGIKEDPHKYLQKVLAARKTLQSNVAQQIAGRTHQRYDGSTQSNAAIKARVEALDKVLSDLEEGGVDSIDQGDLWRLATKLNSDIVGMQEYLRDKGESKSITERMERLGLYSKTDGGTVIQRLLAATASAISKNLGEDAAAVKARVQAVNWVPGKGIRDLNVYLRRAVEEILTEGKTKETLQIPPTFTGKVEGVDTPTLARRLWDHYSSLDEKATHIARELNPKLRADPLEALGKQVGPPVKKEGTFVRLFQDKPGDPNARLTLGLDTEARRGAGVRLPAAGIPRIEGFTSKSPDNLKNLTRTFLVNLKDSGGSALKRGDEVENAAVFTVNAELPSGIGVALRDPSTMEGTGYHVEARPELDVYMDNEPLRLGYEVVQGEAEIPKPIQPPNLAGVRASQRDVSRMKRAEPEVESPEMIPGSTAESVEPRPLGLSEADFRKFYPGMTPSEIARQMALGKAPLQARLPSNYPNPEYAPTKLEGGGRASSPRPSEGQARYKAQRVGEVAAEWNKFLNDKTVPDIPRSAVENAFPGMPVTDTPTGWEVRIPNGNSIVVHKTGWIAIDEAALKEGYGPDARAADFVAEGEFKTLGPDGLIRIVKGEAIPEEVGHAMFSMAMTHRQRRNLLERYGDEESAVKAWNEWSKTSKPEADPTGFFGMVKRFFTNLYRSFKPNVDHTFKLMQSGDIWKQRAQAIESGSKYSAVPKIEPEMEQEVTAKDFSDAVESLSKAAPKAVTFLKVPKSIDPNKVVDAFMKFDEMTKDIPDLPAKPGGGRGVLDLGFNTFRNQLTPEVMRHAVLVNGLMKKLRQGERYANRPELQTVVDSLTKKLGTIDPVEMTNKINAVIGKEGVSHDIEQGLRYVQQLNNTMLETNHRLTDDVIAARAELDRLSDVEGNRRPGVPEAAYKAAEKTYSDALDLRAAQGLYGAVIGNADAGAASLLGRLLRARALTRTSLNPADVLQGKLFSMLERLAQSKERAQLAMTKFMKEGDPSHIIAIAEAATKTTPFDKLLEFLKAGMLGPSSWSSSALGNAGMFHLGKIEDKVASKLISPFMEMVGKHYGKDPEWAKVRTLAEVPLRLMHHAGRIGGAQASSGAWADLRNIKGLKALDKRPHEILDVAEFPHRLGSIKGKLGEFIRIPFKIQSAIDYYFQSKIRARESMLEAWTKAVKDGIGGSDLEAAALKNFETLMNAYDMTHPEWRTSLNQPWVQSAIERVDHELARKTFQRSLQGTPFEYVERMLQKYKGLQLLIPFVRTPANVFLETIRRTPLGVFMQGTGEKGALTARDLSKPIVGTSLMGLFYALAADGDIVTGGGDIDPERREVQKQTGWLPYSVRIGDKWVTYNRFEPLSSVIGIAADMAEAVRRGDAHDVGSLLDRGIQITQNNLTNKTFLSGLSNFMTAYSDPERYGERLAKGLTGMLVPNVIGGIPFGTLSRAMDPTFRQTSALTEPLAKIPGVSYQFPAQSTVMGEERQRPGNFLSRLAFPGQISEAKSDKQAEVAKLLDKIDAKNRAPRRTERVYGAIVEYTPKEFELLKKAHRDATSEIYARAKSGGFNGYPDNEDDPRYVPGMKTKQDIINDIFKKHRGRAKAIITPQLERRARGLLKQRHQEARNDA